MKYEESVPNERLQPTGKGRGETPVANVKCSGRAPSRRLKRGVSNPYQYNKQYMHRSELQG